MGTIRKIRRLGYLSGANDALFIYYNVPDVRDT
jgi:hypothetical protein